MDSAVALAAIGLASTTIVGLFKLLNKLSKSLDALTKSNEKIAKATEKGSQEAKQRNGHLAELVVKSTETLQTVADNSTEKVIDAVQNIKEQKVEHQTVEKQVKE